MFEKNIKSLDINTRLRDELKTISAARALNNMSFAKAENGDVILLKNDFPMDNSKNPQEYAKSFLTDNIKSLNYSDKVFVMGLGVGYILDELFYNTKAKIVIYEPDILYIRSIFEVVDLSKYFHDRRVFISDRADECIGFILKDYLNDDKIEFVTSKTAQLLYSRELMNFSDRLYPELKAKIVNINTIKKLSKKWVKNLIELAKSDKTFYDIQVLENKYKNKSALILGAGPSLKDNIENIKEHRDNFVIFAVNKTLKTLEENNIIPDFAVFVDADYINKDFSASKEFMAQTNIIAGCKTENFVINLPCKNLFIYNTDNEAFMKKYHQKLGIKIYESAATTTVVAFYCAYHLGFEKIYFCGFDLAFKNNKIYCNDKTANIINGKAQISLEKYAIVQVKSVTGAMVNTREDYSVFIKNFEDMFERLDIDNVYNITDFGAYIKGMKYTSFDNIEYTKEKKYKINLNNTAPVDKDKFLECLNEEQNVLKQIKKLISTNTTQVNEVIRKILDNSAFLYQYSQFDIIEFMRNTGNPSFIQKLYENLSKYITEITKML